MSEALPLAGLPLSGLIVLDISSFIAAPAAAVALADFGADVIKIEPPGDGDPHRNSYRNASYPQSDTNFPWRLDGRLKRSIALDLKNADARVVLDISSFIAAPAAAVALADFGADVIKIEPPGDGDPHRNSYRNASYPSSDKNFPWQLDGRLKRSIALDLKNDSARPVLERLIGRADIMIANFPPPARERLRLRWEDVELLNPRLVYCSLTGYGETGPDRDRPGFDVSAYFGRSGILDAARYEGGPPGLSLPAQGDRATAMTLVAAILLGLRQRDRTGKGCWVGTSLYANGVWANGTSAAGAAMNELMSSTTSPASGSASLIEWRHWSAGARPLRETGRLPPGSRRCAGRAPALPRRCVARRSQA